MLSKTIALILVTTGGAYATTEAIDQIKPQAQRDAAEYSIGLIADAAYIDNLLTNDWPQALATTVADARNNEATAVDGTTVYWRHEDACFYAEIPTPDADVMVQPC